MRESDRELLLNFPAATFSRFLAFPRFFATPRFKRSVNSRRKLKANTPWRFFPLIIPPSMSPSTRSHPSSRPTVETPLLASLTVLVFVFAYFFKTSPLLALRLFQPSSPLSRIPSFPFLPFASSSFSSPTFHSPLSSRVLIVRATLAPPRSRESTRRRMRYRREEDGGREDVENGRFHTRRRKGED